MDKFPQNSFQVPAGGLFLTRLKVQARIIHALILREMMTRFGRENFGFFWLMGEPLILCLGVIVMWLLTSHHLEGDIGVVPFVLTGYTLVTLWRHIISRSVNCFRQNAELMFHRNVKYIDTLIARALLEIGGTGISFMIAYIPFYLFGVVPGMSDPLLVVGGWLMMGWLSFAAGLIIAGLSEMSELVERFVQPLMYITLPLTGLFYMVAWLPAQAQKVVLWSPLVHCSEMLREGLIGVHVDARWDFGFLIWSCVILTGAGFVIVQQAQKYVRFG